jgi:hypothetical protein
MHATCALMTAAFIMASTHGQARMAQWELQRVFSRSSGSARIVARPTELTVKKRAGPLDDLYTRSRQPAAIMRVYTPYGEGCRIPVWA